jgi:hypothetical protein
MKVEIVRSNSDITNPLRYIAYMCNDEIIPGFFSADHRIKLSFVNQPELMQHGLVIEVSSSENITFTLSRETNQTIANFSKKVVVCVNRKRIIDKILKV